MVEEPPIDCIFPYRKIVERISCASQSGETQLTLLTYKVWYGDVDAEPVEMTDMRTDLKIEKWQGSAVEWVVYIERSTRESEARRYAGTDMFLDEETKVQRHAWEFELPGDFTQPAKATRTWNDVVSNEELFCSWELP